MNVCDYIIESLYLNNIDTYFIITGGAIVPFIDKLSKNKKISYYCFQHEQSASMAAEGYYRSCGKIAAVCVTSGPGVQNILNGVCGCWYDSIPAFYISGQVNTSEDLSNFNSKPRQTGFQEMPVVDIFQSVTKKTLHVGNINLLEPIINELLTEMKTPRYGPVLMDLPVNIQMSNIMDKIPKKIEIKYPKYETYNIIKYINESRRPLIYFGHGVKLSNASNEAIKLVEKTNIPFVVSWGAFDICETSHELRVGSPGVYGDRCANYAIQNADLIIFIGTRMDSRQIGGNINTFSKYSKKIVVDIDIEEINKTIEKGINVDMKIQQDALQFINYFSTLNVNINIHNWIDKLKSWKVKYNLEKARENDSSVYDYLNKFFNTIDDDCIIIPDQGGNLVWTMQSAILNNKQKLFTNFGNSSMGFALPAAIGASIGTGKKVYCIDGDGGFQMNIQELLTVKKYNLDIDIIILNNNGYGIIKQFQDSYFDSNYAATSKNDVFGDDVNFEQIARAYKINTLIDVKISETQKIYPKLEFGNSLENMTPYIDFEKDMIVSVPPKKKDGWN